MKILKRKCLPLVVLLILFCCTACGDEIKSLPDVSTEDLVFVGEVSDVIRQTVPIPEDFQFSCYSANQDNVFIIAYQPIPMGQYALKTQIIMVETDTQKSELLYEVDLDGHWINEPVALNDSLFWVCRDAESMRIERLKFADGSVETIRQFEAEEPDILLTGAGDFMTWYQYSGEIAELYAYDEKQDEIFLVSDEVALATPYERAYVLQGYTAFTEEQDGQTVLHIFDLTGRETVLERNMGAIENVLSLQANQDWCVWRSGTGEIFHYQWKEDELSSYCAEEQGISVFSVSLMNQQVMINDQTEGGVISIDLDTLEATVHRIKEGNATTILGAVFDLGYMVYDAERSELCRLNFG